MYVDYLSQMISLRDRISGELATDLGLPSARELVIRRRDTESKNITYEQILPRPIIVTVYPRTEGIAGIDNLLVAAGDYEVRGVSRVYPRSHLVGSRIDYAIDGEIVNGVLTKGILCELISITESTLTWDLILREKVGERNLY